VKFFTKSAACLIQPLASSHVGSKVDHAKGLDRGLRQRRRNHEIVPDNSLACYHLRRPPVANCRAFKVAENKGLAAKDIDAGIISRQSRINADA
jgi:hypothetical protein